MKYYYILQDVVTSKNDLPVGPRIKCQNISTVYPKYDDGDGPYLSLAELRKNSPIFKKLLRVDPRRAQKICEAKFIFHTVELVPLSKSTERKMGNAIFEMLIHIVSGKIKNKNVSGGHLYDPSLYKVIKITKPENKKGVWEALIAVKETETQNWIAKKLPTTFFPNFWSKGLLLLKLEIAFVGRKKISDTKYIGYTDCGIPVTFIYNKQTVISVYPIYD